MNENISAAELRVAGEDKEPLGVFPRDEALALARGKGLDLVLIVPDAEPPVARIMNYGKFKYEKEKRDKAAKKLAKVRIDMSAGGARCYFARGRRACPAMRQPH